MTPPSAQGAYSALSLRLRESGARVPDARYRDCGFVEPLRHLSLAVNGARRSLGPFARRVVRGKRRES